jgi:transcriptional regulator of PTS gene
MAADFRATGPARGGGRRQILDTIRTAGAIARIDIAARTGVSPATVTALTSELMTAGLIQEVAPDDDTSTNPRGRPRVALKLRGAAHLVAGLKVAGGTTTVCILDFAGDSVGSYQAAFPARSLQAARMVDYLAETLEAACRANGLTSSDLSGVGLGIAGIVDAPRGFVYWSPTLSQRNIDLRAMMAEKLPLPIFMDNDANLVAKAEQLFGMGRGISDFIVVTIEHGVGMGIVIDNRVYRGTRGCGAEFGHTKVRLDGALCRCGQRGCLEAYVADYALLREAGINPVPLDDDDPTTRLNALFAAAKAGDRTAMSIFQRAGRMFAMGLANLVNIFDPKLIILSGERMQFDFLYADEVLDSIKTSVVQIDAPLPEVRIHKWGDLMWAKGAAAYAMEGVAQLALDRMANNAG